MRNKQWLISHIRRPEHVMWKQLWHVTIWDRQTDNLHVEKTMLTQFIMLHSRTTVDKWDFGINLSLATRVCGVSTVLNYSNKARKPEIVYLLVKSYAISWLCTHILGEQFYLHQNPEVTAFLSSKAIQEAESRSIQG